ncbi:MAG: putative ABC transporter permease [Oscillospiraceae bacterium]
MSKQQQSCVIFLFGFYGYSLIEILWRGHTHWSMALTGGSCFMLLYRFFNQFPLQKLWKKCISAAGLVTCVEYFVGCIVNGVLNLRVWDYSNQPFNLLGQVCLLYSFLWALLALPLNYFSRFLSQAFERPVQQVQV